MTDTPERKARRIIDANLEAAGWLVRSHDDLDLTAGSGIAVREFPMKPGFGTADYVLYVDRQAVGTIEAKPGGTLTGEAARRLARDAVTPFLKPAFRRRILELYRQSEQTIDRHTIDDVLHSGFDASAVEKARAKVQDFRAWIERRRSELTALQVIYAGVRPPRLSLRDLRALRDAIARPPLAATPAQLWRAFEAAEPDKVKTDAGRSGEGELLADLVNLVRVALIPDFTLVPYRKEMRERYRRWLEERDAGNAFTAEQREWLDRMAEHIATSLAIEPEDFETGWFGQQGRRSKSMFHVGLRCASPTYGSAEPRIDRQPQSSSIR